MLEQCVRYATSTRSTTTTSGSGGVRGEGSTGDRRTRLVRLLRPRRLNANFGFSLRGGREYQAGFFISHVDIHSEAHRQGLKVGDQLVTVNGFRVEDAVHKELAHYISTQTRLKIKVRNVGMLPVKDKSHEPLSWQCVSENASIASHSSDRGTGSPSPTLCDTAPLHNMRLSLLVPPRAKLGCGICKGPDWKPGIFVQFVKEQGIARDSGLRPGDQILSCNGVDFNNISFNEAITVMKQTSPSGRLELVIRGGAGAELASPESSGYNSSASSAAGGGAPERCSPAPAPPAALRHRLASVAEEAAIRAPRMALNRLKRRTWDSIDFDWRAADVHSFDAPSDIEPDYDSPSIPNNPHTFENYRTVNNNNKKIISNPSNKTIINLTENGATIQCTYDNLPPDKSTFSRSKMRSKEDNDKKTIMVEVHHISGQQNEKNNKCANKIVPLMPFGLLSDSSSISSSTTLSSAINEEIQRRKLKQRTVEDIENQLKPSVKKNGVLKTVDDEKQKQHDALMDEFKKMHRKMFAQEKARNEKVEVEDREDSDEKDRQQTLPMKRNTEPTLSNGIKTETTKINGVNGHPPPPPPMPVAENGKHENGIDVKAEAQRISFIKSSISAVKSNPIRRIPTPDYETSKTQAITFKPKLKEDQKAELESIESYKLKNPPSPPTKPPQTYFMRSQNGSDTLQRKGRPVSVQIGEYPSNTLRKEPSKLDFLNGEAKINSVDQNDNAPIGSRLQSELVQTLSRSNLRKKTETIAGKVNGIIKGINSNSCEESDQSIDKNFHKRYGNNILPTAPVVSIPKISSLKPINTSNDVVTMNSNGLLRPTSVNGNVPSLENEHNTISFDQLMMAINRKK